MPGLKGQSQAKGDAAFIDPRTDDPFALLWTDIRRDGVYLTPHPDLLPGTREWVKADRTLTILKIDQRATLVKARLRALSDYQARLRSYKEVAAATTFEQLKKAVNDPQSRYVDTKQPFAQEQATMLAGLKASIQEGDHPTVWREMKRQYLSLPTTKQLFESLPPGADALNW